VIHYKSLLKFFRTLILYVYQGFSKCVNSVSEIPVRSLILEKGIVFISIFVIHQQQQNILLRLNGDRRKNNLGVIYLSH